jgi:transposase
LGVRLTESEIKKRLTEGRNYKRLYSKLKSKSDAKIKALKAENKKLKARVAELEEKTETQSLQIAELQAYVFGKKRKSYSIIDPSIPSVPAPRTRFSYKRNIPEQEEITDTKYYSLPKTCLCGGSFKNISGKDYYKEDIPLPDLTDSYRARLVTKYTIEQSRCSRCGRRQNAAPEDLNTSYSVTLGPNLRLWVAHTSAVLGLSYSQIVHLADVQYGLKLSDGEITNILEKQHLKWLPMCEEIKAGIRASPAKHYDETPWPIQKEKMGHAWVMSNACSSDTVFELTTSRGKGHIEKLHQGSQPDSVFVTDDYSAYRYLAGQQQLCWAHLYRASRDLASNSQLTKSKQPWVASWHRRFQRIYEDVRIELAKPYDKEARQNAADKLWARIYRLATCSRKHIRDPDKLRRLKEQLLRAGQDRLLSCLIYATPCDNNRAERDLRSLVLKRKRSFGCKTIKGAKAMSTVLSVCTTMWRRHPDNYFAELARV